jgi:hypothetical protein
LSGSPREELRAYKATFEDWLDYRKGVATSQELLWRIFHPGELHKDVAQLRRIALRHQAQPAFGSRLRSLSSVIG